MSLKTDIEFLLRNKESLESIGAKCEVSATTVWRWLKEKVSPHKIFIKKVHSMTLDKKRKNEKT